MSSIRVSVPTRGWALGLTCLALLVGCKTAPPPVPAHPGAAQSWEARRSELQARQNFQLKGRVAVATGTDGFNARLLWSQTGARSFVSLDGPLGAGGVQITSDGPSLTVVNSHGDHLDSEAAKAELNAKLGFEPPLGSLRYWIQGVPDPAQPAKEVLNEQHRLASVEQGGWKIDYSAYMSVSRAPSAASPSGPLAQSGASRVSGASPEAAQSAQASESLPARVTVQKEGVRVRLIIDTWTP